MIFPPAFLDSSSWNINQQLQPQAHHPSSIGSLAVGGEGNNHHELLQAGAITPGALPEGGGGGAASAAPAKPMSMADRARLARIPQPEPGLKCPRCESTNTKFCYFNNYSLSQPRHFCRACRRYWTRGGALRNVPVGGGYRRHAKRAKPKATPSTSSATTASASASSMSSTSTVASSSAFPAMLSNHAPILPPLHRIADFDAMSLGSSLFGMAKPFMDTTADTYPIGGGGSMGMEQWRAQQIQSFPFLHALDQIPPAPAMAMPGMFHLGLDGGRGEAGGELHVMPMKTEGYPRGVYGDASGYTPYSSTTGNLL